MAEELEVGRTCWMKVELKDITEDGLLKVTPKGLVALHYLEASEPSFEVKRESIRQNSEPPKPESDKPTVRELEARLEERKMCVFHEYSSHCGCFHCKRISDILLQIAFAKERLE